MGQKIFLLQKVNVQSIKVASTQGRERITLSSSMFLLSAVFELILNSIRKYSVLGASFAIASKKAHDFIELQNLITSSPCDIVMNKVTNLVYGKNRCVTSSPLIFLCNKYFEITRSGKIIFSKNKRKKKDS